MSFPIIPRDTITPSSIDAAGTLLSRFSLKGKTAIITGAGAGIGLVIAAAYAEFGANVALWYHSNADCIKRAKELSAKYNVKCIAIKVDIRKFEEVFRATDETVATFGRLDIFVANSGIPWTAGDILSAPDPISTYHNVMQSNVDGVFFSALAAGKHFKRQKNEGTDINGNPINFKLGSFIATASMSGHVVNIPQRQSVYNASKAAVIHFVKCLAVEWSGFARANTVSPGYVLTEITSFVPEALHETWQSMTPQGREGEPHELQGAYLYLASDASTYTTGSDMVVDGGYCLL